MPAVRKLYRAITNDSKPEWIEGHSSQALAQLVRSPDGRVTSVPLTARIHEGVIDSAKSLRLTLLDRSVELFFEIAEEIPRRVLLVADAYNASGKVIRPLLTRGHHLVTRVRRNAVACEIPAPRRRRGPGRHRKYGNKRRLEILLQAEEGFLSTPSPVYDESDVEIHHAIRDLLWRPAGQLVRFESRDVASRWIHHPDYANRRWANRRWATDGRLYRASGAACPRSPRDDEL